MKNGFSRYDLSPALLFLAALPANMVGELRTNCEGMMRKVGLIAGATVTAIAMTFSAVAQPLAPGKPAGAHAAQLGNRELLVFGAVGVAVAAVLIANDGSGSHPGIASTTSTIVTPTTT